MIPISKYCCFYKSRLQVLTDGISMRGNSGTLLLFFVLGDKTEVRCVKQQYIFRCSIARATMSEGTGFLVCSNFFVAVMSQIDMSVVPLRITALKPSLLRVGNLRGSSFDVTVIINRSMLPSFGPRGSYQQRSSVTARGKLTGSQESCIQEDLMDE